MALYIIPKTGPPITKKNSGAITPSLVFSATVSIIPKRGAGLLLAVVFL